MSASLFWHYFRKLFVTAYPYFAGCGPCVHRPGPLAERIGELPLPSFPVDVVYTWVDGADPLHAAKRAAHHPPGVHPKRESGGIALFRDNQELRYSLRSLEKYAPWVRRVFIVTDNQTPNWLDSSHSKIQMVKHSDIIPHDCLPTFNSHVIEAYLHRIHELGEQYIYFNDDFFLGAPCTPGDFFTLNGMPRLFLDWRRSRLHGYLRPATPHAWSYNNTRAYLQKRGMSPGHLLSAHVPHPQTRQNASEGYAFFEEGIRAFRENKFRGNNEMAFYCHALCLWTYINKRAVPCDVPFYYVNTKRIDRHAWYADILKEKDSGFTPLFFCLNDVGQARVIIGDWHKEQAEFLETFFPYPSSFEKQ